MAVTVRDLNPPRNRPPAKLPEPLTETPVRPAAPVDWITRLGLADKAVLTIKEAALVLRISERTLRERIKAGAIPALHFGRRVVVPVPKLVAILLDQGLAEE